MASYHSAEEVNFVMDLWKKHRKEVPTTWVGLHDTLKVSDVQRTENPHSHMTTLLSDNLRA